jgi:hypothetical protein
MVMNEKMCRLDRGPVQLGMIKIIILSKYCGGDERTGEGEKENQSKQGTTGSASVASLSSRNGILLTAYCRSNI